MAWEGPTAPYRIETDRFVVRCFEVADAPLLKEAIDASLEHLREFMVWADDEPQTVEQKVELIQGFRERFASGESFVYGIFDAEERELLGGNGLHPRIGPGGLEIGYWTRTGALRQGIATETSAVLTRAAFEICEADRVEIRIEPANVASLGVPARLGYPLEVTLRRRLKGRDGEPLRDVAIFTLFREDYDPAIAPPLRAYDAAGSLVLS